MTDGAVAWGWKEPRSIYLLRFWNETMPDVRFLHFLRDGRDMAFSENQNQLTKHGGAVLGDDLRKAKTHTRSIALWNRVNLAAADFGEHVLGPRYLRVRFEDLCAEPEATSGRSSASSGSRATPRRRRPRCAAGQPGPLAARRRKVIDEITETARPALERFGYL